AFAFIIATNLFTSPLPTCAASAHAASFALCTSAASTRSCTEMRSPARRLIVDSPTAAADGGATTTSSSFAWSSATSTVISFVMLATGTRAVALLPASTSPVAPFSTRYAFALTCGGPAAAGAATTSAAATAASARPIEGGG